MSDSIQNRPSSDVSLAMSNSEPAPSSSRPSKGGEDASRAAGSIQRIAILNRGEPAIRFLRAVREYELERDVELDVIAFYTDPDRRTPFVRQADDAVSLGPATRPAGEGSVSAYCDHDHVVNALKEAEIDAVWPGWGFVSEDPVFVARLEEAGIAFIGPPSSAMQQLGDKIASKKLGDAARVPMAPWAEVDPSASDQELIATAESIGFPLMVKASAGGGGRGIRKVSSSGEVVAAIHGVVDEVNRLFGQGGVFLEKCITGARHVEIQLVVDVDGTADAIGVRDCSTQRRNQKVIEEAPCPVLPLARRRSLCAAVERLAEGAGYRGVGTAEFLYDVEADEAYFLEVNSRLQVEHTITEMVQGVDLVKAQLDIVRGISWKDGADIPDADRDDRWVPRGHAIEVRLNAENPEEGFRPSPGRIQVFRPPSGPGIRVDSGVVEGNDIAPDFDSMIAKVIAWAPSRQQAVARMRRALREFQVVVEDGATNKGFLLQLLEHPAFLDASLSTAWLDGAVQEGEFGVPDGSFAALIVAALVEYRLARRGQLQRFFAETRSGIPQQIAKPDGMKIELRLRNSAHTISVYHVGDETFLVGPEDALHEVTFEPSGPNAAMLHLGGARHEVLYAYGRTGVTVEINGAMHPVEKASGGVVKAPAPAMVVHVAVEEGEEVAAGDHLLTVEAMKMEMVVAAPEPGLVKSVLCRANQQVTSGQPLVVLEPLEDDAPAAEVQSEAPPEPTPRPLDSLFDGEVPCLSRVDEMDDEEASHVVADLSATLRSLLLGYDVPALLAQRIERLFCDDSGFATLAHPERWTDLARLLGAFADTESLFDRNLLPLDTEAAAVSADIAFYDFCRRHHEGEDGVQPAFSPLLEQALTWYGVNSLEPSDGLRYALWRMSVGHKHGSLRHRICSSLIRVVMDLHRAGARFDGVPGLEAALDRVVQLARGKFRFVADNAHQAAYVLFEQENYVAHRQLVEVHLDQVLEQVDSEDDAVEAVVETRHSVLPLLVARAAPDAPHAAIVARAIFQRLYGSRDVEPARVSPLPSGGMALNALVATAGDDIRRVCLTLVNCGDTTDLPGEVRGLLDNGATAALEVVCASGNAQPLDPEWLSALPASVGRCTISWLDPEARLRHRTWERHHDRFDLVELLNDIHPESARRVELWRLGAFELERLDAPEQIVAFRAVARENPRDERIFVHAEVRDVPRHVADWNSDTLWEFERAYFEGLRVVREAQSHRKARRRFHGNRLNFFLRPVVDVDARSLARLAQRFEAPARGLGLQKVVFHARVIDRESPAGWSPRVFTVMKPGRHRLEVRESTPSNRPVKAFTDYHMRVVRSRRLGYIYPYELAKMLEGGQHDVRSLEQASGSGVFPIPDPAARSGFQDAPHPDMERGHFVELDLDESGVRLVETDRPFGQNSAGVVVGLVTNFTAKHPEGMTRVWIASDPTVAMGALAEPECRRVMAALDLAAQREVPVEWIPISAGARIAMDSGTENLDWTARVLRRIVEFTQNGGEINIIVAGVNVGAQSYWNAEATMLMHNRGILIMTPDGSMVLTGKRALEYSGGVAAEDERGIGGFERIMGVNGQAQYFAKDLGEAYHILFEHYRFTYRAGDEPVRRLPTTDRADRSIMSAPYVPVADEPFETVGEIFDDETNPGRKKPFAIREVMKAVIDRDGGFLERFRAMRHGETAVVWDAHIGGHSVALIAVESRPLPRRGRIPMDGPDTWTGGTLFPQSSKKVARAINTASGVRPVVVLANLSGFDGSPESLRKLQLELGAEIGRAVVNFDGPIVFVVIGRYHGGAYVVFSKALNENMTALALEGTYASVIGGAPAAAVVFPRQVRRRANEDPRLKAAQAELDAASPDDKPRLRERYDALYADIILEKQGELAAEFDGIHSVQRAVEVGSLDAVIPPARLRLAIARALDAKTQTEPTELGRRSLR